jgi:hypothetical protein
VAIKPSFFFIAAAIINEAEGTILKAKTTQRPPILDMNSGEAHADRFGLAWYILKIRNLCAENLTLISLNNQINSKFSKIKF